MTGKTLFSLAGFLVILIIGGCRGGKNTGILEDFEAGSFNSSIFIGGGGGSSGLIISDPKMVVGGKYSAYGKADPAKGIWYEFLYSDSRKVKLNKKGSYNVTFKYKAVESPAGDGFYYFLVRTNTGGTTHDKSFTKWVGSQGKAGTRSIDITLDDFNDYYLIWGIYSNGALSIDDIGIKEIN